MSLPFAPTRRGPSSDLRTCPTRYFDHAPVSASITVSGLVGYQDHLQAATQLSGACGLHRQQRLFRDLLRHNIPFLRQLESTQPVSRAVPTSQLRRMHGQRLLELHRFREERRRRERKNRRREEAPPTEYSGNTLWTAVARYSDTDIPHCSALGVTGVSGTLAVPQPTVSNDFSVSQDVTHVVIALRRARQASKCPHRALRIYNQLKTLLADLGCDRTPRPENNGGEGFVFNKEGHYAVQVHSVTDAHIGHADVPISSRLQFAWSSVVLQTPRQDTLYALFGDFLTSLQHCQRLCPLSPTGSVGRVEPKAGSIPEENLLLQVALSAFSVSPTIHGRGGCSPASGGGVSDIAPVAKARARGLAQRGFPGELLSPPHASRSPCRVHMTRIGFAWHLLALVYERDARTVTDAPEERALLRRCAALCHFMCLYTWPFMLNSWERLVPLILSDSSCLQRISLLLRVLRTPCGYQKLNSAGEGYAPLFVSQLRDILFSPNAVWSSAFLRLSFGTADADTLDSLGGCRTSFSVDTKPHQHEALPWAARVFAFVLRSVAAVQLRMARGEARDALQLLSEWPLLPEGSSYIDEMVGCCYMQCGQPERAAAFLLRCVHQQQLFYQELQVEEEKDATDENEREESSEYAIQRDTEPAGETASGLTLEMEDAGCKCSSALWQRGRRRAAIALVDWLLQRPGVHDTPQFWGAVGNLLSMHGKSDEALRALFRAVEIADDYPYAYTLCAHELLQRGQREEARTLIEHGLEARGLLKSLPLHALSLLLELEHRKQDFQAGNAKEQRSPANLRPRERSSRHAAVPRLQQQLYDQVEGMKELERLQHPQTLKKIAGQFLLAGQPRRAHDLLLRVVRLLPGDAEAFYQLGRIKAGFQQYSVRRGERPCPSIRQLHGLLVAVGLHALRTSAQKNVCRWARA
ncbi:tetratricopeptide repeat-containing protein [Cystoisospora suis]|uniref:Tetratricopeptide repeat-containing protein n=1 Tax=Cystoisospora suis TaxID=483139 RepID=A0A2C6L8I9_9APIC|nr:tetratricopeptide repeat-containing protein [Cystoisospora suis]